MTFESLFNLTILIIFIEVEATFKKITNRIRHMITPVPNYHTYQSSNYCFSILTYLMQIYVDNDCQTLREHKLNEKGANRHL